MPGESMTLVHRSMVSTKFYNVEMCCSELMYENIISRCSRHNGFKINFSMHVTWIDSNIYTQFL